MSAVTSSRSFAMLFLPILAVSSAAGATVEIKGGFSPKTSQFDWEVINHGKSPIVYIEFPHFHADALVAPEGWKEESTNLVGTTVPNDPGVCTARPVMLVDAIAPGKRKPFMMRLSTAGAQIGKADVTVRFADGREEKVRNVELPVKAQPGFGATPAIALGAVFVLYVLVRSLRGRRKPQPESPAPPREEVI